MVSEPNVPSVFIDISFNDLKADKLKISNIVKNSSPFSKVVMIDPNIDYVAEQADAVERITYSTLAIINHLIAHKVMKDNAAISLLSLPRPDNSLLTIETSLTALCRSLRFDYSKYRFQRIIVTDVDTPIDDEQYALEHIIWGDVQGEESQTIKIENGNIKQPLLTEIPLVELSEQKNIYETGSYLITGGVGALGLNIAQYLVERNAGQLLLLTRRAELDERIKQRISTLNAQGCDVQVLCVDIGETADLEAILQECLGDNYTLRGVVHCAGVLKDQLASQIDLNSFNAVQNAKVKGTFALHKVSQSHPLDFFIMFGSVAAAFGNAGQGAYAVANGFLEDFARYRRQLNLPAQTIAWGPWQGDGMADSHSTLTDINNMGIALLESDNAIMRMQSCLEHCDTDPIVIDIEPGKLLGVIDDLKFTNEFKSYVKTFSQNSSDTPDSNEQSDIASSDSELNDYLKQCAPQSHISAVIQLLREKMAACFGTNAVLTCALNYPLVDLGFDSLMAVKLRNVLEKVTETALPISLLYDYPSIEELAQYLVELCIPTSSEEELKANDSLTAEESDNEEIAIIGLACRLPGGIESPQQFWQVLEQGIDCVGELGNKRWEKALYFDKDPDVAGKMYSQWGGLLEQVNCFDNNFFEVSSHEALMMDPQQRLLMEVSWQALENANIVPSKNQKAGVFIGCGPNEYSHILSSQGITNTNAYYGTGNSISVTAGRLSYFLGWQGPAIAIDTACSSSLVSINLACDALRKGDCSMALAGGVNLTLSPQTNVALSKARMLSPVGRCKTFDDSADGYVRSEGCALVVLKKLKDAQRDGDNILAVIKAGATNHDGRSQGLTAPNGPSQERVMTKALARAKLSATDIQYVEAHGTGTPLGDPIEMNSIEKVYLKNRQEKLFVGSVKSNIGHTEAAAGVSSLIKVVLMLQHQKIVKNLHLEELNKHFSPAVLDDNGLIEVPKASLSWPEQDQINCAAVSSFGFSGTNAHLIVGQAPQQSSNEKQQLNSAQKEKRDMWVLPLSAKSKVALQGYASRYIQHLKQLSLSQLNTEQQNDYLASLCLTAGAYREHFEMRQAISARDIDNLLLQLQQVSEQANEYDEKNTGIAFMFTGQGSQYVNMGKKLAESANKFKEVLQLCNNLMLPYLEESILDIIWGDSLEKINNTFYTQPALFALEYALAKQWQAWGIEPDYVLGHSVGEYAAACLAGVFSLEDAIKLICARSRLMTQQCDTGAMVVLFIPVEQAQHIHDTFMQQEPELATQLSIAAENTTTNTVFAGSHASIECLIAYCQRENIPNQPLTVSHGFHSVMMQPMLADFEEIANSIQFHRPKIRFISTLLGKEITDECCQAQYWVRHVHQRVLFSSAVECLSVAKVNTFLEIGPASQLVDMANKCLSDNVANNKYIPSIRKYGDDWQQILEAVTNLYQRQIELDWQQLYNATEHLNASYIPNYAFQRKVIWPNFSGETLYPNEISPRQEPLSQSPLGRQTHLANDSHIFEFEASYDYPFIIEDHRLYETVVLPGASHLAMLAMIGNNQAWGVGYEIKDVVFPEAMIFGEQLDGSSEQRDVQYLVSAPKNQCHEISAFSRLVNSDTKWVQHFQAKVHLQQSAKGKQNLPVFMLDKWQENLTEQISGVTFYNEMAAAGYQLKNSFRWIDNIWRKPGVTLTYLRAPNTPQEKSYLFYPGLMDAFFQSTAAATYDEQFSLSNKEDIYIPMAVDDMAVIGPCAGPLWCYVELLDSSSEETFSHRIWVFNEAGETLLWVDSLRSKRAPKEVLLKSLQRKTKNCIYGLRWQELSLPIELQSPVIENTQLDSTTLILGYKHHANFIEACQAKNIHCIGLDLSEIEPLPSPEEKKQAIYQLLDKLLLERPINRIISLVAVDFIRDNITSIDGLARAQAAIIQPNLFLQQYAIAKGQEPQWLIVSPQDQKLSPPVSSILAGYTRVLRNESTHSLVKHVIVDSAENYQPLILQEFLSESNEPEVRYQKNTRQIVRFHAESIDTNIEIESRLFDANKSYLVAGGLGAIGIGLVNFLINHGAQNIVITTRNKTSQSAEQQLNEWQSTGVRVEVWQCDVTQHEEVVELCRTIETDVAPLDGIFNCAGVLNDGLISNQSWQGFQIPLTAKIQSSWCLHEVSKNLSLNWFVLFSSAASVFGSAGQASYACANSFLDGLAEYRRHIGLSGLSINWGPWAGNGMAAASEVVNNLGRTNGLNMLDPDNAFLTMAAIARHQKLQSGSNANFTVIDIEWDKFTGSIKNQLASTFFSPVAILSNQATENDGMALDIETYKREIKSISSEHRFTYTLDKMTALANELMAQDIDSYIDPAEPLQTLGFDSLMALELRNVISKLLDKSLPATLLFDLPTLREVSEFMIQEIFGDEIENLAKVTTPEESIETEISIDDLSDSDLAKLLEEELI
ncbi:SDR family NAD(P)-dependent oxidoreductase [Colwelliaceae bacterium MEBiC 14330]